MFAKKKKPIAKEQPKVEPAQDKKAIKAKKDKKKSEVKEPKQEPESKKDAKPKAGRFTEEGFKIYTTDELNIGKGGDTADCPFDCNCCF